MRKIVVIIFFSLFINSSVSINKTGASVFDIFKDPTEACMDLYVKEGGSLTIAAEACRGITKSEYKCVKKLVTAGTGTYSAIYSCRDKGGGIFKF
ncbi:hypothetical protein OAY12_04035 [Candidatus Pelagibacter sp.]|nr:hypothetical protein [Candidatus Pelagibacter sp.]